MLYKKMPHLAVLIGENECLSNLFLKMLKQGSCQDKSIRIKPNRIYQMECNNDLLTQFSQLQIRKRYENQSNLDNELLLELILNNFSIDQFLSLEILIIHQSKNSLDNELLTIVNRLGRSSSFNTISLRQYRISSNLTTEDLYLLLHEIYQNFYRLKVMTIEFHQDTLFDNQIFEQLTDIQKKNSYLDYIYLSKTYIELHSYR